MFYDLNLRILICMREINQNTETLSNQNLGIKNQQNYQPIKINKRKAQTNQKLWYFYFFSLKWLHSLLQLNINVFIVFVIVIIIFVIVKIIKLAWSYRFYVAVDADTWSSNELLLTVTEKGVVASQKSNTQLQSIL